MNKGFMQTFAIILLILSSLLLLSIRFEIFILSGIRDVSFISDKSALRYSVRPESIVIRSGQENSTKLIDKNGLYYMDIYNVLGNALKKKHRIEKINLSEYRAMKDSKSIIMNFDPAIDQRLLYGSLFLQDGTIGEIDTIKEIILPQITRRPSIFRGPICHATKSKPLLSVPCKTLKTGAWAADSQNTTPSAKDFPSIRTAMSSYPTK